jgi:signal transduction histidine kinase
MIKVQRSDSPFIADWYVISLRWLVLLGATVFLAFSERLFSFASILLLILTLWNIALSWLAGISRRIGYHRHISLAIDIIISGLFFWLQGGLLGSSSWMVLLPVLTGAIYFDLPGAMFSAVGTIFFQVVDVYISGTPWIFVGVAAGVTLFLAGIFGYLSQELIADLRKTRKQQIEVREKRSHRESDRLRAIYNLTSTLTATLSYKRVLDQAIDLSADALYVEEHDHDQNAPRQDTRLVSAVLLFKDDSLIFGSSRGFSQADTRSTLPGKSGLLAEAIDEGEALVAGNISQDPELSRLVSLTQCNAIYCFPLRSGLNVYGVMIYGHPDTNYFTRDRRDVLDIIGRQSVIAIQNARLYQDLADEKERMAEAQEEARKKLARDLHDGPTQSVAAIAMRVSLVKRIMTKNTTAAIEELEKIEDLARRTTKEIRHMLFTLRPLVLESQGLSAALQSMADKIKETFGQDVIIQVDQKLTEQLEMGKSGVIFYIAEEAVNNARKHAQAPHIWVKLNTITGEPEIALLEISDDGVGFDVESVNRSYDKRGSLGMVNLRERSELVNGILQIDSAPGKGTRIQVYIPLSEDAADKLHRAKA